ncbi:hypothetical protein JZ751_002300, partial [Albula glossodonta]
MPQLPAIKEASAKCGETADKMTAWSALRDTTVRAQCAPNLEGQAWRIASCALRGCSVLCMDYPSPQGSVRLDSTVPQEPAAPIPQDS